MAIATGLAIAGGVAAAAGMAGSIASAAGQKDPTINMGQRSPWERQGEQFMSQGMEGYRSAMGNEVAAGSGAQLDFANMLKQYAEGGNMPTQQDISQSQAFAASQFNPQRVAMQQAFADQLTQANRQAALSGRNVNDPILRAKLAESQTRQGALLESQQGAFASNFAMQQPGQRLGFMGQRAETLVNRGQMALSNQANMFNMGSQAQQQGYGQRFQNAQLDFQRQLNTKSGCQKAGEALSGSMSALGSGMSIMGMGGGMKMPSLGGAAAAAAPMGQMAQGAFSSPMGPMLPNGQLNSSSMNTYGFTNGVPTAYNPITGQSQQGFVINPANIHPGLASFGYNPNFPQMASR
jgi:hypothetical protein